MTEHLDPDDCPGCEDSDEAHACGFVNGDCPDSCSYDHDVPARDRWSMTRPSFTCPESRTEWRWCSVCEDWTSEYTQSVEGGEREVCDSCSWEYTSCDACGYTSHGDNMMFSERHEASYCSDCYDEAGGDGGSRPGHDRIRCHDCDTYNDDYDEITETFVCRHVATERRSKGTPMILSDERELVAA